MSKDPNSSGIDTYALVMNLAQQNNNVMGSNAGAAGNLPPGFMDVFTGMGATDNRTGNFQPNMLANMFAAGPGMTADLDPFSRLAMDFDNGNLQGGLFGQMLANPGYANGGIDFFGAGAFNFGGPQGPGLFGAPPGPEPVFDPMGLQVGPLGTDPMMAAGPLPGSFFGDPNPAFGAAGLGGPMYAPQQPGGYDPGFEYQYGGFGPNVQHGPGFGEPYAGAAGMPMPSQGFDPQYTSNPFPGGFQPSDGYPGYPQHPGYMQGPRY
jgi:hypothetical protein